jgi:multiple sugar transport system substrate-binding protein
MWKRKALFFCVGLFLVLNVGCSTDKNKLPKLNPNTPVKLTVWNYYTGSQKEAFDKIVQEFNDSIGREKGIIVEAISQGGVNELADKLLKAANSNKSQEEMPDIFAGYSDTLYDLNDMNKLAALDKYLSASEIQGYVDNFIKEARSLPQGELKIFPIAKSTELLFVNETDWDKFIKTVTSKEALKKYKNLSDENLDTWEGIYEAAEVYYKWTDDLTPDIKNDGKALFGLDSIANFQLVGSKQLKNDLLITLGGKGKVNIDKSVQKKLWDFYIKGIVKGYFAASGRFRSDDLKTGKILMYIGSSSSAAYTPNQVTFEDGKTYNINSRVLTLPVFKDGSKVAVQQGAGMAVKKSTDLQEYASVIFLKYFTDTDKNVDFVFNTSYLPVKKSTLEAEKVKSKLDDLKNSESVQKRNLGIALEVSLKQFKQYDLYFSQSFAGSFNARKALENAVNSTIVELQNKIKATVSSGGSYEEAVSKATDEEAFNSFLEKLEHDINKEIK